MAVTHLPLALVDVEHADCLRPERLPEVVEPKDREPRALGGADERRSSEIPQISSPGFASGSNTNANVFFGPTHTVYVDIGSATNATPQGPGAGIPRASVLAYQPADKRVRGFATGIWSGDVLSFAPDGTLWTAVNQRDDIAYPFHRAYGATPDAYGQVMQAYVDNLRRTRWRCSDERRRGTAQVLEA